MRIFGSKRGEITRKWRKVRYEELNVMYSLLNIVRAIKLRRIRWAGRVALMGRGEFHTGFWWRGEETTWETQT
jgi:hypothetical protein